MTTALMTMISIIRYRRVNILNAYRDGNHKISLYESTLIEFSKKKIFFKLNK